MGVKLAAASGGSIELVPTNTASNFTVTVPAVTATVLTDSAGILNIGSGQIYKDASGNVGIGTTSLTEKFEVSGSVNSSGQSTNFGSGTQRAFMDYTSGTTTARFGHLSGASGSTTGVMAMFTNGTERARIDSSGNLLVGTTSQGSTNSNSVGISPTTVGGVDFNHVNGTSTGVVYARFNYNASAIGSITQSGTTAVLYNVTSDQRLKENIVDAPEFGSVIDSLKVRSFDWKTDQTHQRAGFVAQELVTVAPEAVHQPANPDDMMAVDYSKLVPMLVKEIQSLRKRLAAAGI